MKFCQTCGKEIMDEAIVCPNCGCAVGGTDCAGGVLSHVNRLPVGADRRDGSVSEECERRIGSMKKRGK